MKKFIIAAAIAVLVIIIAGVAFVLAFGSALRSMPFGKGTPRDLGVTYTEADYTSAKAKIDAARASSQIQTTLSDAELTAYLNECQEPECVLSDVQVRTGEEGVVEISGVIDRERVEAMLRSTAESNQDLQEVNAGLAYLPGDSVFYLKAELDGEHDTFFFDLHEAQVAKFPLPNSLREDINEEILRSINGYLTSAPGTQVRAISVTENGVFIDADWSEPVTP